MKSAPPGRSNPVHFAVTPEEHQTPPSQLIAPEAPAPAVAVQISPNAKVQFVWDLRDTLAPLLTGAELSPSMAYLRDLLAGVEAGHVDRRRFDDAFFAFVSGRAQSELSLAPTEMVPYVLGASLAQLKTAFDGLRSEATRPVNAAKVVQGGGRMLALGRSIVSEILASDAKPGGADNLSRLLDASKLVPAFAWGHLASAVEIDDPKRFVSELAKSTSKDLVALKEFIAGDVDAWQSLKSMIDVPAANDRLASGTSGLTLEQLMTNPERSTVLAEQAEQLARGIAGVPQEQPLIAAAIRARQRTAAQMLVRVRSDLEAAVGAEMRDRLVSGLDLQRTIAELADVRDGIAVYTDLDSPRSIAVKADRLRERLAGEALRELGDRLRDALVSAPASERVPDLAKLVKRRAARAPHTRVVMTDLLLQSRARGQSLLAFTASLAQPGGLDAVLARITRECAREPAGYLSELASHWDGRQAMEAAVRQLRGERRLFTASLGENRLLMDAEVQRTVELEMEAAYPTEGLGYLAADGARLRFVGVENALLGSDLGHSFGLHDQDDLARLHWLFSKMDLELIGKVHSHPDASPVFSDGDLRGVQQLMSLAPDFRMVIVGTSRDEAGKFTHRFASFVGGEDGQLRAEDTIEAA